MSDSDSDFLPSGERRGKPKRAAGGSGSDGGAPDAPRKKRQYKRRDSAAAPLRHVTDVNSLLARTAQSKNEAAALAELARTQLATLLDAAKAAEADAVKKNSEFHSCRIDLDNTLDEIRGIKDGLAAAEARKAQQQAAKTAAAKLRNQTERDYEKAEAKVQEKRAEHYWLQRAANGETLPTPLPELTFGDCDTCGETQATLDMVVCGNAGTDAHGVCRGCVVHYLKSHMGDTAYVRNWGSKLCCMRAPAKPDNSPYTCGALDTSSLLRMLYSIPGPPTKDWELASRTVAWLETEAALRDAEDASRRAERVERDRRAARQPWERLLEYCAPLCPGSSEFPGGPPVSCDSVILPLDGTECYSLVCPRCQLLGRRTVMCSICCVHASASGREDEDLHDHELACALSVNPGSMFPRNAEERTGVQYTVACVAAMFTKMRSDAEAVRWYRQASAPGPAGAETYKSCGLELDFRKRGIDLRQSVGINWSVAGWKAVSARAKERIKGQLRRLRDGMPMTRFRLSADEGDDSLPVIDCREHLLPAAVAEAMRQNPITNRNIIVASEGSDHEYIRLAIEAFTSDGGVLEAADLTAVSNGGEALQAALAASAADAAHREAEARAAMLRASAAVAAGEAQRASNLGDFIRGVARRAVLDAQAARALADSSDGEVPALPPGLVAEAEQHVEALIHEARVAAAAGHVANAAGRVDGWADGWLARRAVLDAQAADAAAAGELDDSSDDEAPALPPGLATAVDEHTGGAAAEDGAAEPAEQGHRAAGRVDGWVFDAAGLAAPRPATWAEDRAEIQGAWAAAAARLAASEVAAQAADAAAADDDDEVMLIE